MFHNQDNNNAAKVSQWKISHEALKANFCPDCGTLLDLPTDLNIIIRCDQCAYSCAVDDLETREIVTRSRSIAADIKEEEKIDYDNDNTQVSVAIPCEQCGKSEVTYYTKQLRSADEGQTAYYTCKSCGHKWSDNI